MPHEEYLRRNLAHAKSIGVRANLTRALDHLLATKHPPKWLVDLLKETHARASDLPVELEQWRNIAPDSPANCVQCHGMGYLVDDAEFDPYAVQCPGCKDVRQ